MDRHDLNRMFDALAPVPGREGELLDELLQDGVRRKNPMKNWKRVVVAGVAAALLITGAAAAVVVPELNRSLRSVLDIEAEDKTSAELLAPGTMAVDITTESNGATLHITQVLRDQVCIVVVGEFSTGEGTVLDTGDFSPSCWKPRGFDTKIPQFVNAEGEPSDYECERRMGEATWWSMADEDPLDDRCSVYFRFSGYSGDMTDDMAAMRVVAKDFGYYVGGKKENYTTIPGDWSFEVPLPQKDIGYVWDTDDLITNLDGADINLRKVYLSPMELELTFFREGSTLSYSEAEDDAAKAVVTRWWAFPLQAILTTKDGKSVTLDWQGSGGSIGEKENVAKFIIADFNSLDKKGDYIDPADFVGGALTLEWRAEDGEIDTVSFPLDDLQSVSP